MTARQREVLEFIRIFGERHGVPPTVREIGERFHFTARAAFDHLRALERKGMLERRVTGKRASRTLVLPAHKGARRVEVASPRHSRARPHRGGRADHRGGEPRGHHPAAAGLARHGRPDVFALRVRGDSMIDAHIMDGDLVLVRGRTRRAAGDIVAAMVDGEATVKRFARDGERSCSGPSIRR